MKIAIVHRLRGLLEQHQFSAAQGNYINKFFSTFVVLVKPYRQVVCFKQFDRRESAVGHRLGQKVRNRIEEKEEDASNACGLRRGSLFPLT
jgi:hypothetical protein